MPQIGTLVATGTATLNPSYLPQFLQIGPVDETADIEGLTITARGKTLVQLNDGAQIDLVQKLESMGLLDGGNTTKGKHILLATGRIEGQSTITIAQPTTGETSAIYEHSLGKSSDNLAREIAVSPVTASGNLRFVDQDYIAFLPANVARVQVTYQNGYREDLETEECAALFQMQFPAEADGLVEGFVVIPFLRGDSGMKVKEATIYATSGGNVDVIVSGWTQI
jgi:hypothetical protein